MKTVRFNVQTLDAALEDFASSWKQDKKSKPAISFASWEVMHRVLAPNRLAIVQAMTGAGVLSIREVARRIGRDFKAVHSDITVLLEAGVVQREGRGVVFPYDNIHVEFDISTAA